MWERPWMPHANIAAYIFTQGLWNATHVSPQTTLHVCSCAGAEHLSRRLGDDKRERHTRASVNCGWSAWEAQATMHAWGFHLISLIFDVNTSLMSDLQAEELWVTHQSCRRMLNTCNYCLWVVYTPRGGGGILVSVSDTAAVFSLLRAVRCR